MDQDDLHWDDEQELLGLRVRVHFFDPDAAAGAHAVERALPVLAAAPTPPRPLHAAGERGHYELAGLQAHPDAVYEHGNGLICLLDRSADGLMHEAGRWSRQLRGDAVVQAVVAALAVAGHSQRPTAALLRCHNALYQIDPSPAALECLATSIAPARLYAGQSGPIGVQQLASYCEPKLRALPAPADAAAPMAVAPMAVAGGSAAAQCDIAFADTMPFADTAPSVADIAP